MNIRRTLIGSGLSLVLIVALAGAGPAQAVVLQRGRCDRARWHEWALRHKEFVFDGKPGITAERRQAH